MNIEIVTVDNSELKETGFGAIGACNSVLASVRKLGHKVDHVPGQSGYGHNNKYQASDNVLTLATHCKIAIQIYTLLFLLWILCKNNSCP